jgi:tetratricopeptide (TPR) repeat protein
LVANHEALVTALLVPLGRLEEAVNVQREACARNPLAASAVATLGALLAFAGNERDGIRRLEAALDLEPRYARAYVQLGKLHLAHERPAEALPLLRKAAELAPDATSGLGALAVAYARLGRGAEAEAIGRRLGDRAMAGRAPALARAEVAMALGRVDEAFRWLDQAVENREPWVVGLAADPLYRPLRSDPRFSALLRRLGLRGRPA